MFTIAKATYLHFLSDLSPAAILRYKQPRRSRERRGASARMRAGKFGTEEEGVEAGG